MISNLSTPPTSLFLRVSLVTKASADLQLAIVMFAWRLSKFLNNGQDETLCVQSSV